MNTPTPLYHLGPLLHHPHTDRQIPGVLDGHAPEYYHWRRRDKGPDDLIGVGEMGHRALSSCRRLPVLPFRWFAGNSRGANAVEFALIAPLFLLLVFAMIDFGLVFGDWLVLTNGVREGARVGVVTTGDLSAKTTEVTTAVNNYTATFGSLPTLTVACSDGSSCGSGTSSLKVTATRSRSLITPLGTFMAWFGGSIGNQVTLSSSSEMRNE